MHPLRFTGSLAYACLLIAASTASSQDKPAQAPVPTAAAASASSQTALRTNANLVVVDVVVTDAHHSPVRQLTASDFTVLEDGHPQTIGTLEEHGAAAPAQPAPAPASRLEPGTFTNDTPAPADGALNILLLDKLNTPAKDEPYLHDQLLAYLKDAHHGERIAIFGLTSQLWLIQGFTTNPEILRAALNGKNAAKGQSPLMDNPVSGDQPGADDTAEEMIGNALGDSALADALMANLAQYEAEQRSETLQLRARFTLDAFNQLGRSLGQLPGRKNLIWFSGSFPINIFPDTTVNNPFSTMGFLEDEFRQTIDLLARSQVAVYPVDARGMMTSPMLDPANSGHKYLQTRGTSTGSTLSSGGARIGQDNSQFVQQTNDEQGTMLEIAQATGGQAFVTNKMEDAVQKTIEAGSHYYTLAYSPTDHNWNGHFRNIQVKLDRPGATLAYRRGYYADDPKTPPPRQVTKDAGKDVAPYNAMRSAMQRGGPEPNEIVFQATVRPDSAADEPEAATGNRPNPKTAGPFRRFAVNFAANSKDVDWVAAPDGVYHCLVEFITFVYDRNGALVNLQINDVGADLPAARYARGMKGHLLGQQQISVPAKGEYFLRLGVHDVIADRVGALELPVASVAALPSAGAQPPVPGPTGKTK